jgi:YHS domain-containing protein
MLKPVMICLLLAFSVVAQPSALAKQSEISTGIFKRTGASGYDVVAYFMDGKAIEGTKAFRTKYKGAEWRFASAAHREAFVAAPEKYLPQYGGYCAWAVSKGYTAPSDPKVWKVIDGKLYLNYNADIQATWSQDISRNILSANKHWPMVLDK